MFRKNKFVSKLHIISVTRCYIVVENVCVLEIIYNFTIYFFFIVLILRLSVNSYYPAVIVSFFQRTIHLSDLVFPVSRGVKPVRHENTVTQLVYIIL